MTLEKLKEDLDKLNEDVKNNIGKPGGWASGINYEVSSQEDYVLIEITDWEKDAIWKRIDPWGFAFLNEVQKLTQKPFHMVFYVRAPKSHKDRIQYEALKRRLSYLNIANDLIVELKRSHQTDSLYSFEDLSNRPECEKVRTGFKIRGDKDKPGRLEKDFQTYLFGKGLYETNDCNIARTNERLALFGPDFVRVGKKNRKVEREFPTGAFLGEIKEENRILPTEYVDLITINKKDEVSLIELKFNDPKLEVVSQVLNYALFFNAYKKQLALLIDDKLSCSSSSLRLKTYLVSNVFHERFDSVFSYYANGPLIIKQIIMGHMQ